jgi:hypothetical protein
VLLADVGYMLFGEYLVVEEALVISAEIAVVVQAVQHYM